MRKSLLTASSNLVLLKKGLVFQILLFGMLLGLSNTQTISAQCIGPYQVFESVPNDIATLTASGWSFSPDLTLSSPSGYAFNIYNDGGSQTNRTGIYGLENNYGGAGDYMETPTIATPLTFSCYLNGDDFDLQVNDGTNGWESLLDSTVRGYYGVTATSAIVSAGSSGSAGLSGFPFWDLVSVTFGGTANSGRSNSNLKLRIVDNLGAIIIDDIAWTSRTSSENTIVVPELGTTTTCTVTVPAAGTGFLTFYDQGGNTDSYNKGQTQTITFAPAVASEKVQITFQSPFGLVSTSNITVYNGPTTGSPILLNAYTSTTTLPGVTVYASTDASGNITVRFITGTGNPLSGFKIKVECVGCTAPTALAFAAAGGVSHNSAFLTWSGTASNYDIYYSTTNTAPTGATSPNGGTVATTSATVTGLSASTLYYFWVRSNCGAGSVSSWLGPISRTTLCTPQSVIYFENFNGLTGGALPTCTSTTNVATWKSNSFNGNLYCNGIGDSFFTQGVTLTAGQLYRATYDYSSNGNGTADLVVEWGHPTNDVAPTQSNISTYLGAHYSIASIVGTTNIVNFTPSVSGTHYLEFFLDDLTDPVSGQLNIDNVKIEIETCLPPTFAAASPVAPAVSGSPEVTGLNDFGATVAWLTPATGDPSNGYYYYVNTTNTPPGYYDTPTGSTGFMQNSVTLGTLSPNTRYYVWVRANCGGQISVWSTRYVTFVTTNITAPTFIKISDTTTPYNVTCGQNIVFTDSNFYTTTGVTGFVTHAAGDYTNGEFHTYTFVPTTAGAKLKVVFNSFRTENTWDGLLIYSGTSAAGTLMSSGRPYYRVTCPAGAYSGTSGPGTIVSTAADGSLTFVFRSDASVIYAGWTAAITCITNPPTITSFTPANNSCGTVTTVVITGTNFTSVSNVSFNGASASYTVNSSTQITATLPATGTTGKISVTTAQATAVSLTDFVVQNAAITTSGATVCLNSSGTMSAASCDVSGLTSFTGSLTSSSPIAPKPSFDGTTCGFVTNPNYYYTATQITVSVTGTYELQTTSGGVDLYAYIASGSFTAGSCATGTFIESDDDGAGGLQPYLSVTLTAGVVYTLFTTTFNSLATANYTWNVTPPIGGTVTLYQSGQAQWYTAASGGSPFGVGSPFNPVGVAGSGLANTASSGTTVFYAACSSNPDCRTATNFVVSPATPGTASSNQTICSGTASDLTLVGNAGVVTRWQYCPNASFTPIGSVVDIASSASNTLTSTQIGSFAGTRYYRAQVAVGSCTVYSNVITITYNKVIWDGAGWFDILGNPTSAPTSSVAVEFQGDFISSANAGPSGDVSACSVVVTSGADVLFDIGTLTVQNDVNVSSGFLTIEDNASLYQVQAVANAPGVYSGGNLGSITSKRVAEPMYKFDYTYWSSPVNPQNLLAVSPASPQGWFLTYNATTNAWQYVASPGTTTMTVGKGYLIRAPLNYPVSPSLPLDYTASFTGVPNNGTFTTPIVGGAAQMNLIGNPYPSALYAPDFINGNTNVNGTLYFWTHNTSLNPVTLQYAANDYAIYNLVGGTLAAPTVGAGTSDLTAPLGYIASGQGFFVKGLSNGTATFSNSMRRAGNNTQFYKSDTPHNDDTSLEKHRYWVDITNSQGDFKQVLIGYIETATSGLDRLFDGDMVDVGNAITLYTTVEDTKLSIQGRPLPFDVADTIPLGYKSTINGNYTISLSHYDGLFTTQHVYIEDKVLNIIHDLRVSPYTFATLIGTFEDRFELRYTDAALETINPVFNENSVVVYKNNQGLYINSGAVNMATVNIFDIRGRLLATQKQVDRTTTVFTTLPTTNQVLLVRIESENGAIVTKKVVY